MMKEQQVESKADDDTARASAIDTAVAAFRERAKIMRARDREAMAKIRKEFCGERRKAFIEQGRIKIKEHNARMELRKREAVPMEATSSSSTASPPKPDLDLSNKLPKSSSPAAHENFKDKHNSDPDQIKPVLVQPLRPGQNVCGIFQDREVSVYDLRDPKDCTLTPQDRYHIRKNCILALQKYNNENGTNYRYVSPLRAHRVREPGTLGEAISTLTFRASDSDSDSDSKTFIAKITSGRRFSKGDWRFVKEIKQVYQVLGSRFD